jgi:HSP20 family protein
MEQEDRTMRELRPFSDLERWARRLETRFPHLFEDAEAEELEYKLPVESYVKDGNVVVRADVPGIEPKDIDVNVLGNVLTIKARREEKQEVKKENYFRREISYGEFERRTILPEGARADKARATFKNGVLEVTIPSLEEGMAKKVPVETAR